MILTFRPVKLHPEHWKPATAGRPPSPFGSTYSATLDLLDRELSQLNGTGAHLQVDAKPGQVRADGQLRSDARVDHPGVILTIETREHGTLIYETDKYGPRWGRNAGPAWQENLRAVALGLEALRKVERYGIATRGQQYAGYRELGSGMAMGAGEVEAMTLETAALLLADAAHAGGCAATADELLDGVGIGPAYFAAAKALHPDHGGDADSFRLVTEARTILLKAVGP